MKRRSAVLLLCILVICIARVLAQAPSAADILTNKSVIEMVAAKLPEDVIVVRIQTSKTDFDLSTPALVELTKNGVSSNIIKAMIAPAPGKETVVAPAPPPDPNDPEADHDPRIYMHVKRSDKMQLILLEPTVYTQGKSGGVFTSALTYGIAKVKWKAVVRNAHANVRTADASATFYFHFEEKGAGLSHAGFGGTSTPNEFTLLRFDVKSDSRETVVMKMNAFGSSSGTDDKASVPYTFTKVRPGIYKVVPNAPLQPGEYAFFGQSAGGAYMAGAAAASRLFDFSIVPAE
jgi:hypothetical protein